MGINIRTLICVNFKCVTNMYHYHFIFIFFLSRFSCVTVYYALLYLYFLSVDPDPEIKNRQCVYGDCKHKGVCLVSMLNHYTPVNTSCSICSFSG